MKSVLLSIRPKWCEKICHEIGRGANGKPIYEKVIEVRKSNPNEVPFRVLIYCTQYKPVDYINYGYGLTMPAGKVIGEFICDRLYDFTYNCNVGEYNIGNDSLKRTCLSYSELEAYGKGKTLYGWHISDLKIYDKPRELSEFRKPCPEKNFDTCLGCRYFYHDKGEIGCTSKLKRPPQSWCYIEGAE